MAGVDVGGVRVRLLRHASLQAQGRLVVGQDVAVAVTVRVHVLVVVELVLHLPEHVIEHVVLLRLHLTIYAFQLAHLFG